MVKITIGWIIQTSIVTAFTIAAALIWKDVIESLIKSFVPAGEEFFYRFIVAIIATIFVVIAIYIILKAQSETKIVWRKLKRKERKRKNEI